MLNIGPKLTQGHRSEPSCFRIARLERNFESQRSSSALLSAHAIHVFGNDESFDPTLNNLVRMHAGRLRERLAAYYASIGQRDFIVVEIPKGRYAVVFRNQEKTSPCSRPPRENF
jgi:hypothetical protein